ncbi:MAG: EcsC family protein [Isosphaeraceae bacterium]
MDLPPSDPRPVDAYEKSRIDEIAAWKASHANPFGELARGATLPLAKAVEFLIPDRFARAGILAVYSAAEKAADPSPVLRRAGVDRLEALRELPLERCDRLAARVAGNSRAVSFVEGAVTGAGGMYTTLLDIPLLFGVCLRTILQVGHCYGYPLDRPTDRAWVLGAFAVALSPSRLRRNELLARLREIEDLLLEETEEQLVIEEMASLISQIEAFEALPIFATAAGAALNLAMSRKVDRAARFLFRERWLRDNGRLDSIAPSYRSGFLPEHGPGSGALARAGLATAYAIGFGVAFPSYLLAAAGFPRFDRLIRRRGRSGESAEHSPVGVDQGLAGAMA